MTFRSKAASVIAPALLLTIPFLPAQEAKSLPLAKTFAAQTVNQSQSATFGILRAALIAGGGAAAFSLLAAFLFRRVVSTNTVHIVQSGKETVPYGANLPNGNVYYEIPSWVPKLGVSVIRLPVSNFDVSLESYEAYDEDRVPFLVDVCAFFRIKDASVAAKRITDFKELHKQLEIIVQGAVRRVLAASKIDSIMTQRSTFGEEFSEEVRSQLVEWGVESIKNMELMDIRDSQGSKVISNIMAKKTSEIERNSRVTVAENNRQAEVAEVENKRIAKISAVEAEREIALSQELAEQQVGERAAEKEQAVGVAQEQSRQQVLIQQAQTKEKDLEVRRVEEVRVAEITRDTALVQAEMQQKVAVVNKETALIAAEQEKETTVLVAEGRLESERREAEAIQVKGVAQAEAEKALQLAPVSAQIALSQEIGSNEPYQKYLAMIEAMKAYIAVGVEQAQALKTADVKVIANGGSTSEGLRGVSELFSSKGGTSLAAALEGFAQSDLGADLLARMGVSGQSQNS